MLCLIICPLLYALFILDVFVITLPLFLKVFPFFFVQNFSCLIRDVDEEGKRVRQLIKIPFDPLKFFKIFSDAVLPFHKERIVSNDI